ncbi:MAG TPA: CPBP family intramembrane glutamic endopeptidase [Pirellulales bacterium]|nr:CPBP family intramembrane glutamic endopeptidase [Pirellulales bacterium]
MAAVAMDVLLLLAVAGVITASLKAWLAIVGRWRQRLPLVEYEPRQAAPWTGLDLLVIVVVYFATNAGLLLLVLRPASAEALGKLDFRSVVNSLAATSLANLATVAFAIGWTRLAAGATWSDLGLRFNRARDDVRLGLAAFAAVSVPIYVLQALLSQFVQEEHPIITLLKEHRQPWLLALCAFSAVIVAPLAEEFFFRVLLQGWLESLGERMAPLRGDFRTDPTDSGKSHTDQVYEDKLAASPGNRTLDRENPYAAPGSMAATPELSREESGPATSDGRAEGPNAGGMRWRSASVAISSLVFSLLHLGHGADPVPLFFLALALGYLYQRTGRLLPSVVVHFCLNTCSLIALWFSVAAGVQ